MKRDKILLPILVKFVLNTLKQIRRCPLFSLDLSASTFLWKTQPSTYLATFRRPHSPLLNKEWREACVFSLCEVQLLQIFQVFI